MRRIPNQEKVIENLCSLVRLDYDAILVYQLAIEKIEVLDVKKQLTSFKRDHERHVQDLCCCIEKLGGAPPERRSDTVGFLMQSFTRARSTSGTPGALRAMRGNEVVTNLAYDRALSWEMPLSFKRIIEANRDDEIRHLAYIEKAIRMRAWEIEERAA